MERMKWQPNTINGSFGLGEKKSPKNINKRNEK
jgi:hypothetical protein